MAFDFTKFIRQPTTIHALGVIAAGAGAALVHVATGNPKADMAVAAIAYVLVHLGIDDHSAAESSVTSVMADAIAVAQGKTPDAAKAIADVTTATNAVGALLTPAPVVVVPAPTPAAP